MTLSTHNLDYIDGRLRELQGFLRGILLDGDIDANEVVALERWLDQHAAELSYQHPFNEIVPYLRIVLADSTLGKTALHEELQWMLQRIRQIHLRHPSSQTDLSVFLGVLEGVLVSGGAGPTELDNLLQWIDNCPSASQPDAPLLHLRESLASLKPWAAADPQFCGQYLRFVGNLLPS